MHFSFLYFHVRNVRIGETSTKLGTAVKSSIKTGEKQVLFA